MARRLLVVLFPFLAAVAIPVAGASVREIRKESKMSCCIETNATTTITHPRTPSPLEDPHLLSVCGRSVVLSRRSLFQREASIGDQPWVAALGYRETNNPSKSVKLLCEGSIITNRYILTAAHCVTMYRRAYDLFLVRLGEHTLSTDPDCVELHHGHRYCARTYEDYGIEEVTVHPDFDPSKASNNIALIRLDREINLSKFINPICLPPRNLSIQELAGESLVLGWGFTEEGATSDKLLNIQVEVVNPKECNDTMGRGKLTEGQFCAKNKSPDSCQDDSGSPLVILRYAGPPAWLIGVASFVVECGQAGYPAVYTSVSNYRQWIERHVYA